MVLKEGNDIVNDLNSYMSASLRFTNLFRVSPAVRYEIIDIKHCAGTDGLILLSWDKNSRRRKGARNLKRREIVLL